MMKPAADEDVTDHGSSAEDGIGILRGAIRGGESEHVVRDRKGYHRGRMGAGRRKSSWIGDPDQIAGHS